MIWTRLRIGTYFEVCAELISASPLACDDSLQLMRVEPMTLQVNLVTSNQVSY